MKCIYCFNEIQDGADICPCCGLSQSEYIDPGMGLPAGTILNGQYQLGKVLGHGGFGITYIALDLNLQSRVAIKEYMPSYLAERSRDGHSLSLYQSLGRTGFEFGVEQFLNEARLLAKFQNHPNIVGVSNFFKENGTAYFVMDYIEGKSIKEILKTQGPLDWASAVSMILPVTTALEAVHAQGLLHRDISPDNIFVTTDGETKLLDFGAARYAIGENSKSLSVILKPGFAPEEQYRSHGNQGPWTDIYALGATLYRMITGKLPQESIDRMFEDSLLMPREMGLNTPEGLDNTLRKAMAVKAEGRYQNVGELRTNLIRVMSGAPVERTVMKRQKAKPGAPKQGLSKNTKLVAAICGGAAVVIAAVALIVLLPGGNSADSVSAGSSEPSANVTVSAPPITSPDSAPTAKVGEFAYMIDGKWGLDYSEKDSTISDNSLAIAQYEETYLMLQDWVAIQYKNGEVEWTGTYSGSGTALTITNPTETLACTLESESKITFEQNGYMRTYVNFDDEAAMTEDKAKMDVLLLANRKWDDIQGILGEYDRYEEGNYIYNTPDISVNSLDLSKAMEEHGTGNYVETGIPADIFIGNNANIGGAKIGMSFNEIKDILGEPTDERWSDEETLEYAEIWYLVSEEIGLVFFTNDYGNTTTAAQLTIMGGHWD